MMVHPITKRLNGIDLDQPARGWALLSDTSLRIQRATRRSPLVVARRHGSVPRGELPVYEEATAHLAWELSGTSQVGLEAAYDELMGVLTLPGLVYEHVVDGRVLSAPAAGVSISEPTSFVPGASMDVSAAVALTDPFLRDATPSIFGPVPVGGHVVEGLAGTAPIADAVVRFTGPFAQVSIVDQATGSGLTWTGTASSGQYLYLDAATLVARRSTSASAWESGGTDVSGGLDYPAPGPLQLWPVSGETSPGVLRRQVQVQTSGGPCAIRGKRAWL